MIPLLLLRQCVDICLYYRSDSVGWKLYNISLGVRNGVIIMALYQVENPGI